MPEPVTTQGNTRVPPLQDGLSGATPSPVVWRALALLLDALLAFAVAALILSTIILPKDFPDAEKIVSEQWQAAKTASDTAMNENRWPTITLNPEYITLGEVVLKTVFLVCLAYFAGCEMALGGTTPGKRVFGLRTARWGSNEIPHWLESLTRNIFKSASLVWLWPGLFIANVISIWLQPSRRALHDYLGSTMVTGDAPPAVSPRLDEDEE